MMTIKNNRSAGLALLLLGLIPFAYNNCSAKMSFEASEDSVVGVLNSSGTIVINNGDEFTKSQAVTLGLSHISAQYMYVTNDPTCATGGTWEPVSPLKSWTLANANTQDSVYVKYSNDGDGGLASGCLSDAIVHDDIPPAMALTNVPPLITNASDLTMAWTASDSGSGVDRAICSQGGNAVSCGLSSLELKSAPEGVWTYSVLARDKAGNESPSQSASFTVDRTPPTIMFNMTPSAITNDSTSEFRISGADSLSGLAKFECRVGPKGGASTMMFKDCQTTTMTTLAEGENRFEARSVDKAGNMSSVATYDWMIDASAPTVTITKTPKPYSKTVDATFEFTGDDGGQPLASYSCSIDGGAAGACTSPYTKTGLSEGNHNFSVTGTDSAGNKSMPATYSWMIDVTAPTVTITQKPLANSATNKADFVVSAMDSGSGIDYLECQLDGGGYKTCDAAVSYSALADGPHRFDTRAYDKAGNTSTTASYNWTVDTAKPTVTITKGPAPWVNVKAASIEFTATDANLTGLVTQCKLDGGAFANCTSPMAYTALAAGSHNFTVRAIDAAGNMSDDALWSWSIDLTAPVINIGKQPLSLVYIGSTAEIAFDVTDSGSGVNTVMCGLNGTLAPCQASDMKTYMNQTFGDYTFSIVATDKATNQTRADIVWKVSNKYKPETQLVDVNRLTKLDVLVVIDNSGSMSTEQANMAARFGTFLDQLNGLDWQVGIVTTDVSSNADKKDGRLLEFANASGQATGKYVITSAGDLATNKAWFGKTIQRPASEGSGNEQGVAASYRALQRSQQTGDAISARNAALFRADAALATLVVTDADETNPAGTQVQNKPETLINYVKSLWPSKPFSFHSIIVPLGDAQCKSINGNENYGYNYDTISLLTGGIRGTVCANDYGSQLQNIGMSTQDLVKSVQLACTPLDTNNDGMPDLTVITADGSPAPAFTFMGMRVNFATPLPLGTNRLMYNCVSAI